MSKLKVLSVIVAVFIAGFVVGWVFEVLDNYVFRKIMPVFGEFNIWMPQFWKLF